MLISEKQRKANQANAKKSTGPKTPAGRDITRLNAMKTALYTKETVVYSCGETDAMWDSHLQCLVDSLRPQDPVQYLIVHDIASCTFRLQRIHRMESGHLDSRAQYTYNATMATDKDGTRYNPEYDGYPNGENHANARLEGDTAAQVTTCTKLLPEIWRQEQRLRKAWQDNLKLLKQLQSEPIPEEENSAPEKNEPQLTETTEELRPQLIVPGQLKPSAALPTGEHKPNQPSESTLK